METGYPLLRLAREQQVKKREGLRGGRRLPPNKISYQVQLDRLSESFEKTAIALLVGASASIDARTVVPERVVVFELKTQVKTFVDAAQSLGFEWLASQSADADEDEDDDDAAVPRAPDPDQHPRAQVLYLTMPSKVGLQKLLAQWNRYQRKEVRPTGDEAGLWELFDYLVAIRRWSIQDRFDPALARYVELVLREQATQQVRLEIDLWYRATVAQRDKSRATLVELVGEVGGELLDLVTIDEIQYQGALVALPPAAARQLLSLGDDNRLGGLDEVMAIRPQSLFVAPEPVVGTADPAPDEVPLPTRPGIAAMLDGYPITGHDTLTGRLSVLEVDVTGAVAPVSQRHHGTAMASLIVRGDLHVPQPAITRPLLAIPILSGGGVSETTPPGRLPIGVVHRALTRLVQEAKLPGSETKNLFVINHSVCDVFAPFTRRPSPWAALLDHFSYAHDLLFVVSAGNIEAGVTLPDFPNAAALYAATPLERQAAFMSAVEREKARRGMLSPAESINSLTVGALHEDGSSVPPATAFDPFPMAGVTSLASAMGLGVNEGLKPDLVESGGRVAAKCANTPEGVVASPTRSSELGQLVAAPSASGRLDLKTRTAGTSNAAALVTRSCHFIADALDEAYADEAINWSVRPTRAPLMKALITHTSSWGSTGALLERAYPPQGQPHDHRQRRRTICRVIGYGRPNTERAVRGAHNRATVIAEDTIAAGKQHVYRVPLPPSLVNPQELRYVTVTLAWTAPVMPLADYRGVRLTVLAGDRSQKFWHGVKRTGTDLLQPDHHVIAKGTLTHIRLHGRKVRRLLTSGTTLEFAVNATPNHGTFEGARVPYALVVTLETGQVARSNLYQEVRQALRSRVATRVPGTRVR